MNRINTESGSEVTIYTDKSGALVLTRFTHIREMTNRLVDGDGEHVPADYAIETFVPSE